MKKPLRIGLAQINCTVGDLEGNARKITHYIRQAESMGADIVVFPELALTGYPPEDLLLKEKFISDTLRVMGKLARAVKNTAAVIGFVDRQGNAIYNSAAVIFQGKIKGRYSKTLLPNYGVFDEKRYFSPGHKTPIFKFGENVFAVNICEDIWHVSGPTRTQAKLGSKLILNINASPYHAGKIREREEIIRRQSRDNKVFIAYINLVGGQDELVFDGQSMLVDPAGKIIARAEAFQEELLVADIELPQNKSRKSASLLTIHNEVPAKKKPPLSPRKALALDPVKEVYQALLLGLRDYVTKNGFARVLIGLSGGIDSALVAVLAAEALGNKNVVGVFMPSRFSSRESYEDARQLAQNLGIEFLDIPIEGPYQAYLDLLKAHFQDKEPDITEENLQARIRGNILMALSNKFRWLVLTTGNKSEMSTGYATLYGDMAGGFAVIKDVPKILVYQLSQYRNAIHPVIPERILTKAPTAELRPNQKDSDTLPVYETLDAILRAYIEEDKDAARIIAQGFDPDTVFKVVSMVDKSEYKRRQSPPGIKITHKAFGKDRRMPITNRYKG